ncbi:hypothetical protein HOLleu_10056 [Holothuria leucospilota]|uniref:Uncharacterized protein n=1 Tax=Holothuria leucospilota TaxID=206669 RepID=A0A9Q1CDN1_HOLLE|nr:hypothetical protein HOLleu_10056 [Holothuria leucospilota]
MRICIDRKYLNENLQRNHYSVPTIEDIMPDLGQANVSSVFDAKFLSYKAQHSIRQVQMVKEGQGIDGMPEVKSMADDILIYGEKPLKTTTSNCLS